MKDTLINLLRLAPLFAFFVGYHKFLTDELQRKLDSEVYARESEYSHSWQLKSHNDILAILTRIEKRVERIENKLMD